MINMVGLAIYIFAMLIGVAVLIASYGNYKRTGEGKLFLILCSVAIAWVTASTAVLLIPNQTANILVWNLGTLFTALSSLVLLLVMYQFFFKKMLPKTAIIALAVLPALTAVVIFTSPFHTLLRDVVSFTMWPREIVYETGIWWPVHTASSYILVISSVVVLIVGMAKSGKTGRAAGILFAFSLGAILVSNLIFQLQIIELSIDPTSIGAAIALLIMHIALTDKQHKIYMRVFNTLKARITFPVVFVMMVLIMITLLIAARSLRISIEEFEEEKMSNAVTSVQAYLRAHEQKTFIAASALGGSAELIRRIDAGVQEDIWEYAFDRKTALGVDEIIISSAEGITLARSHIAPARHNPEAGINAHSDNISGVPSVGAALRQEFVTFYSPTPTAYMVMTSTAPIMDGDRLVGGIVVNFVVGSSDFLDGLADIFNIDATVFVRAGRSVASTLIHPETGNRGVGTYAREDIIATVIEGGRNMSLELPVFGFLPYNAYYFPLLGIDRQPNGMFFIGISQEIGLAAINSTQHILTLINVIGLAVAAVFMFFLIFRSMKPLDRLANNVKDVAAGNVSVNIDASTMPTDEIGLLAGDIGGLRDVLKSMLDDMAKFNHETNVVGDIEYRIDASKYQGGYNDMIKGLNQFTDDFVSDMLLLIGGLSQISEGVFNADINDMPGKKMVLPNTLRAVTSTLQELSENVVYLAQSAAAGKLDVSIDAGKFKGNWAEIAHTLNSLVTAVEKPLSLIEENLTLMSQGNFANIEGEFQGDFNTLKAACNKTGEITLSYISEIAEILGRMAQGDLTVKVNRDYIGSYAPIKTALEQIISSLNKTISDIATASDQVLSGAGQISNSATALANGAQVQSASVQELNSTIDALNEKTMQNAEVAAEASTLSARSNESAQEGNASMNEMLNAMEQIKTSSDDIAKIIRDIEDISFQTNLLALNASVEAARAGEHGRGFAVVAEEVRTLAGRTGKSASQTNSLIATSISRVEAGSDIAATTSGSLNTIVENVDEVSLLITRIAEASKEQADAIEQVSMGLAEISKVVQSNSAVSEQTAAASQELNSQAELLRQLVAYFRL